MKASEAKTDAERALQFIRECKSAPEAVGYAWSVLARIAGYQGPAPWDERGTPLAEGET